MPIYLMEGTRGEKPRLVKASSQAKAHDHVTKATSINAEQLADHIAQGVAIETAGQPVPAPAGEAPTPEPSE